MTTTDDTTPDEGESTRDLDAELDEGMRRIEENERAKERLFIPSPDITYLLWQVCGAWETVIEEVRFLHYTLSEEPPTVAPFVYPDGENVAKDMRKIARKVNLRLPSDTIWSAECKRAKEMRDHLGHMLHFKSIKGTSPDQTVELSRVPYRQPDEMSTDGGWARHLRITITITEQEAREVLADLRYVNDSLFALRKFGMEFNTWADSHSIDSVMRLLTWWVDDWGPEPQHGDTDWVRPTMGQLRIRPKAEFDASLPPSMRPEF
ncbi:hypothetical protein ACFWDA_25305 [Rhodococcus zopfii]|uniref:hypothetical protein n=1 Tax=Rhodococcus zopfii TaxID=43772 RepID=UPI0036593699